MLITFPYDLLNCYRLVVMYLLSFLILVICSFCLFSWSVYLKICQFCLFICLFFISLISTLIFIMSLFHCAFSTFLMWMLRLLIRDLFFNFFLVVLFKAINCCLNTVLEAPDKFWQVVILLSFTSKCFLVFFVISSLRCRLCKSTLFNF